MKIATILLLLLTAIIFTSCMEEIVKDGYYSSSSFLSNSSSSREATAPQDSIEYKELWYKTVQIGSQTWFAQNLSAEPMAGQSWCHGDLPGRCVVEKKIIYGRLYDWEAAMNVCPEGWKLPSREEFEYLKNYEELLNNTSRWYAVFGGCRYPDAVDLNTYWCPLEDIGYWWSSSDYGDYAHYYFIYKGENRLNQSDYKKTMGLSVRCIKK